jgi:CubicO group peptidase (beta-lactamase class C family)
MYLLRSTSLLLLATTIACSSSSPPPTGEEGEGEGEGEGEQDVRDAARARIAAAFAAAPIEDATLIVGRGTQPDLVLTKGTGGVDVAYDTDSAQKWLLATMLVREARAREVPLTAAMSTWPQAPSWVTGDVADITLRDLLSFTSGYESPPLCAQIAGGPRFDTCVVTLATSEVTVPRRCFYGAHHFMVAIAGLYAADAAAGDVDETQAMLAKFQAETGLLASATYDGDKPLSLSLTPW